MTTPPREVAVTAPDPDDGAWAALLRELGERVAPRRVVGVRREPHPYRTSYPVEAVDVDLDDGSAVPLVLKDLSRDALTETARRAKPAFLHDPLREIEVYRAVLPDAPPGPPAYY